MKFGVVAVVGLVIAVSACSGEPASPSQPVGKDDLLNAYWVLDSIDVRGVGALTSAEGFGPTMQFFRGGSASATDGCNTSSGTYVISEGSLSIATDGFWTLAACFPSDEKALAQRAFHDGWSDIERVHFAPDVLTVFSSDATMELRRHPLHEWPVDGTRWRTATIEYGTAELIFDLDGSTLTIEGECMRTSVVLEGFLSSSFVGVESSTADVCKDGEPTEDERAQHDELVEELARRTTVELVAGLPVVTLASGGVLDLRWAGSSLFDHNRPRIRAASDGAFSFQYVTPDEVYLIQVVRSGNYLVTGAPWDWSAGSVTESAIAAIGDLVATTSLKALRKSVRADGDGGCWRTGEIRSLRFAKNQTSFFSCALDADPSDPLLATTLDLIRAIVADL